jgi:NADH-quinone oxidoreductase subunit M
MADFNYDLPGLQFVVNKEWIPVIHSRYHMGIDGISLPLLILSMFITVVCIIYSWNHFPEPHNPKGFLALVLLLEVGMNGTFTAQDLILFFVFFEIVLLPMFFMIGVWGGPNRQYASIKFFLFTLFGSALMLLSFLALFFLSKVHTFDMVTLTRLHGDGIVHGTQLLVFGGMFLGFAIKVPMFPFHTWLPDAHVEAPTAGSVILAGVLLKMGTYGFVRFSLPILPQATMRLLPWMAGLSIIGIIYGALVAMAQKDMKKLVAYSSVSHLGFVMLGIFALNGPGLNGGILQMINHGLSTGALFLLVGIIYERRHTRMIAEYGGLSAVMPVFATIFLIITMSSIGLPALNGFVGEFTILVGAFNRVWWWAVLAALGIVLGAAYMLWLFQRVFFGPLTNPENRNLQDLNKRELLYLMPLVLLCFWIGLYPKPFFRVLERSVEHVIAKVDPSLAQERVADQPVAATAPVVGE